MRKLNNRHSGRNAPKINGQDHVISRVSSALERGEFGLQPDGKPLGSFLFLGPTGVGKTQLTLEFSRYLFGEGSVFRFEMSEFLRLHHVTLLMAMKRQPWTFGKSPFRMPARRSCSMKSKKHTS